MAITLSEYPPVSSPAACPKCGSMHLSYPWQGRRTALWLSTCFDCGTPVRSSEKFEILPRKALRYDGSKELPSVKDGFQRLASARLKQLNAVDPKLKQLSREPGEEG